MHDCPLRLAPSQLSPGSTMPLPQIDVMQVDVSLFLLAALPILPLLKPKFAHVSPFRFAPSHCSPGSMRPLPQLAAMQGMPQIELTSPTQMESHDVMQQ